MKYYTRKNKKGGSLTPNANLQTIDLNAAPVHSGLKGLIAVPLSLAANIGQMGASFVIKQASSLLNISTEGKGFNEVVDEFNKALKDPVMREKLKELAGNVAEEATIIIEATTPAIKNAFDKFITIGGEEAEKMGTIMVRTALDVLGTIPVAGEVIEGVRVFDDVVKGFQAAIDAGVKAGTTAADVFSQTLGNIQALQNAKTAALDRVNSSMSSFNNVTNGVIPNNLKPRALKGGKSKRNKKYRSKTINKRVRRH